MLIYIALLICSMVGLIAGLFADNMLTVALCSCAVGSISTYLLNLAQQKSLLRTLAEEKAGPGRKR